MPHPAQRIKKAAQRRPFIGALAVGVAPAVSNTSRNVLDAATLAHLVQALDVSR